MGNDLYLPRSFLMNSLKNKYYFVHEQKLNW